MHILAHNYRIAMFAANADVVDLDTSIDCVIEEAHTSTDSSLDLSKYPEHDSGLIDDQADSVIDTQTNNEGHYCSQGTASLNGPSLRLAFKDSDTFKQFHSMVSACNRDTLFARKKAIEVSIDGLNDSIFNS